MGCWKLQFCSWLRFHIGLRKEQPSQGACIFWQRGKRSDSNMWWLWMLSLGHGSLCFWSHFVGQCISPGQTWNSQPHPQAALERATGLGCCDVLRLIVRILGFIVSSILIDMFGEFCCGNDFFPEFFFLFVCVWSSIGVMWRLIQFYWEQLSDRILNVKSLLFHYIFFSPPSSLVFYLYWLLGRSQTLEVEVSSH